MAKRGNGKNNGHAAVPDRHPAEVYINRIVALEEDVRGVRLDIRQVYDEAKEAGHTKGAIRIVVKEKLETEEQRASRKEVESEADQIRAALGMLRGTPLGDATETAHGIRPVPLVERTPYELGQRAYQTGAEASTNPFQIGGAERDAWQEGWIAAFGAGRKTEQPGDGEGRVEPAA